MNRFSGAYAPEVFAADANGDALDEVVLSGYAFPGDDRVFFALRFESPGAAASSAVSGGKMTTWTKIAGFVFAMQWGGVGSQEWFEVWMGSGFDAGITDELTITWPVGDGPADFWWSYVLQAITDVPLDPERVWALHRDHYYPNTETAVATLDSYSPAASSLVFALTQANDAPTESAGWESAGASYAEPAGGADEIRITTHRPIAGSAIRPLTLSWDVDTDEVGAAFIVIDWGQATPSETENQDFLFPHRGGFEKDDSKHQANIRALENYLRERLG